MHVDVFVYVCARMHTYVYKRHTCMHTNVHTYLHMIGPAFMAINGSLRYAHYKKGKKDCLPEIDTLIWEQIKDPMTIEKIRYFSASCTWLGISITKKGTLDNHWTPHFRHPNNHHYRNRHFRHLNTLPTSSGWHWRIQRALPSTLKRSKPLLKQRSSTLTPCASRNGRKDTSRTRRTSSATNVHVSPGLKEDAARGTTAQSIARSVRLGLTLLPTLSPSSTLPSRSCAK